MRVDRADQTPRDWHETGFRSAAWCGTALAALGLLGVLLHFASVRRLPLAGSVASGGFGAGIACGFRAALRWPLPARRERRPSLLEIV